MMNPVLAIALALSIAILAPPIRAIELIDNDRLTLRGFGTLGGACFSADSYDFGRENRPDGPGKSGRCDAEIDSTLGLQLDSSLTNSLQATLQAISYHRADDSFTPELTQANLRWEFAQDFSLRAGRMQTPLFFTSEYRNVLHAQPWVRPPVELYNLVPAYSIDGLEMGCRRTLGGWGLDLRVGLDSADFDVPRGDGTNNTDEVETKFAYVDVRLEHEFWLIKGSFLGGNVDYSTQTIDKLLSLLNNDLASGLSMDDKRLLLFGLGVRYETNFWLVQSEYLFRTIDSFYRDGHAAYVMAGRHFGEWMPYSILARRWTQSQGKENKAAGPSQYAVEKSLVDSTYTDRTSLAFGLSRRLGEQVVLKFQMDLIKPDSGTVLPDDLEQQLTLNLDFVF